MVRRFFCGPKSYESDVLWTPAHGYLLEMHGLVNDSGQTIRSVADGIPYPLNIPEQDILDKRKGDFLTKILIIAQTIRFICQCAFRWTGHLDITELEVITLAFAALNILTYFMWWDKPQGIEVPIAMQRYRRPIESQEDEKAQVGGGNVTEGVLGAREQNISEVSTLVRKPQTPPESHLKSSMRSWFTDFVFDPYFALRAMLAKPDDHGNHAHIFYSSKEHLGMGSMILLGTVIVGFGGMHLIPIWLSSFPSTLEKRLWIVFATGITAWPFVFAVLLSMKKPSRSAYSLWPVGFCVLYLLARLALFAFASAALRKLPPSAYRRIIWADYILHFQ